MTEPITVDDYKLVSDEFFQKYDFVKERLQLGAKAEDVLKVMEALSAQVLRNESKINSVLLDSIKEKRKNEPVCPSPNLTW